MVYCCHFVSFLALATVVARLVAYEIGIIYGMETNKKKTTKVATPALVFVSRSDSIVVDSDS